MAIVSTHALRQEELIDDADLDSLVREVIAQVIGDVAFVHSKAGQWSSNIVEGCLKRLAETAKPFKYIVTCTLGQKAGAGLHTAASCRWEEGTDGKLAIQWENNSTQIIVTVFWLTI